VIVRVDALPLVLEARRVVVAEVIGGYHGQAGLGRWWLPSGLLAEGEQPGDAAVRIVKDQLGLDLADAVVVGTRQARIGEGWQLALVVAGAAGGEPAPRHPVSGFAARTLAELPDQVGFWHRDELALLAARYERLRGI
jgi:ADP-ribose pyrophosphatase YjhB (NUDIX family)